MSDIVETIRIKSTHPESQGNFVEINKADFDPERHELYGEAEPQDGGSLGDLTVAELKALAEEHGIDLGDATKKADIIAKLEAEPQDGA